MDIISLVKQHVALIDEAWCIGCGKCFNICQTKAIYGRRKMLHTVITELCTGCQECVPFCPMDCIKMIDLKTAIQTTLITKEAEQSLLPLAAQPINNSPQQTPQTSTHVAKNPLTKDARKIAVAEAIARAKAKKLAQQQAISSATIPPERMSENKKNI